MQVSAIARQLIEPLCEVTAKVLLPAKIRANDRLRVELSDDGKHFLTSSYALLGISRVGASGSARSGWLTHVPGKKELNYNGWQLPSTDTSAIFIDANWPREQLDFSEEAERWYDYLLLRFMAQTVNSQRRALFHLKGEAPAPSEHECPGRPAAPHQRVAFETSLGTEGTGLWMEQGTGKTYPSIMRIMELAARPGKMKTVLVVCPKNVRKNWEEEVERFATQPGKITVLRGGHLTRMKLLIDAFRVEKDCRFSIVVVGYEGLVNTVELLENVEWDLAIADESHAFKWHRTKRWEAVKRVRDACSSRLGLTGTPAANNLFDMYTQLEWLGEGLSGFDSYKSFKEFYGKFTRQGEHVGYENLPLLKERLARLTFQVKKLEVLKALPERYWTTVEIAMTTQQRNAYIQLQGQLMLELGEEMNKRTVSANNVLTKLLRLTQITSGFLALDAVVDADGEPVNAKETRAFETNPKVEQLREDVRNMGERSKMIVWCQYKHDFQVVHEMLEAEGVKHVMYYGAVSDKARDEAVYDFNHHPGKMVLVGNPACLKEGVTLLGYHPDDDCGYNVDTVVRFDRDWSLIKLQQSNDRCHRRGTRVQVEYRDYIVPSSIDEEIRDRVTKKEVQVGEWTDVKEIMERVLTMAPEADD